MSEFILIRAGIHQFLLLPMNLFLQELIMICGSDRPLPSFQQQPFSFYFRWFWDYAGGLMTDWGVHLLDFALYGMNVTAPKSIMAMGGKYGYPDDACETPDSLQTIYEFDGFNVMWDHAIGINDGGYGRNAVLGFVGENGTLVVDRDGWEVIPEVVHRENPNGSCTHGKREPVKD